MKPKYQHDCNNCVFLGRYVFDGIEYDLYVCPDKETNTISTVIARYGDNGPDYYSGLYFAKEYKKGNIDCNIGATLFEALKRARKIGYSVDYT